MCNELESVLSIEVKPLGMEVSMKEKFERVKQYLHDMNIAIVSENEDEELVVVEDEENGIKNLVIDCEEPILVLEQVIMAVASPTEAFFKRLLQMNRYLVP
jgi:hypothetical protein